MARAEAFWLHPSRVRGRLVGTQWPSTSDPLFDGVAVEEKDHRDSEISESGIGRKQRCEPRFFLESEGMKYMVPLVLDRVEDSRAPLPPQDQNF